MTQPQAPMIHLNGTSRERLLEQLSDVLEAARALEKALCSAAPNGRDYYPLGPEAFKRADDQHRARLRKLGEVITEVEAIGEQIA